MATLKRHFWGWDKPVLENAVAHLTHGHAGDRALDLADTLIIVPTSEAGRRLKEALARAVPAGALVPWVWTAEQALLPPALRKNAATILQSQMAWQQALGKVAVEKLTALFPLPPEERGWIWQTEMARLLAELKSLLGAGGLTFTEVAERLERDKTRWSDLAIIEAAYLAELVIAGLSDAQSMKLQGVLHPTLPEGVARVLVIAAPDLLPLFKQWVQAAGGDVTIAVQAPDTLAHTFDEIGRPMPECWGEDTMQTVTLDNDHLHIHHDASTQAEHAIHWLRELASRGRVAVGTGDPEVGSVLEEKLGLEGVRVFEPGGVAPTEVGLWHVLSQMRALLATGSWKTFAILLRVPEVRRAWLKEKKGGLRLLEEADNFAMERMPVTLDHALNLLTNEETESSLHTALLSAQAQVKELKQLPLPQAARALLIRLYGEREFSPTGLQDQLVTALGDAWLGCCQEVAEGTLRFGLKPKPEEAFALSLEALSRTALSEPRGEVDLVLQGWLELLWEPAPNLIVAGLNEEHVPGILISHPFLPDRVRQELGLPNQSTRFARDAYTLRALTEQRVSNGALHVLCGQWSERGDALRPSRLLFLCEDKALPQRVAHLFPKEEKGNSEAREPARTQAWKLAPRIVPPKVETISPSRIRSYLECPFRDYLQHELHMEPVEPGKRELAPNEFGNLVHVAFQKLAGDPQMKLSTKAAEIADFLIVMAEEEAERLYGRRSAPLINLQIESLKQRLRHAADMEAAQRQDGWLIYAAEWEPSLETPLLIEGARLKCKVDRIERHDRSGHIRVIDYKTSDKLSLPTDAHVRKVGKRRPLAEEDLWKCFDHSSGTCFQWKDLQLPLYAAVLRLHGLCPQEVGYFTLPKSVQDTKVLLWEDFSNEWVDRALTCAGEVVKRLREGLFWPPSERAYDRGFDELFLGDLVANTAWNGVAGSAVNEAVQ